MAGTVTVVIPTYRNPGTLARAVESVLAQDYTDLVCLVINDGADPADTWAPLAHLNDPRLVRFDLTENRGRFYAEPRRAAWQARERLWAAIRKAPTPDLAGHPSMQPHPDTAHSLTRDTARLREVLAPEAVA